MSGPAPELLEELQTAAAAPRVVTEDKVATLREHVLELANLEDEKEQIETRLEEIKSRRVELSRRIMPELFDACGTDQMGIPELDVVVQMVPYYYANIASDWEPEKREEGFAAIEALGGQDIIRVSVTISYGPREMAEASQLVEHLRAQNWFGNRPIEVKKGIPWQTSTAFLRERIEAGDVVPLEKIGGIVGRDCKVKKRKASRRA